MDKSLLMLPSSHHASSRRTVNSRCRAGEGGWAASSRAGQWVVLMLVLLASIATVNADEVLDSDHVSIRLLAPETFAADGASQHATIGIHFTPDPGWHVYWRNPGDSGAAPRFAFKADNVEVSTPRWPYPERLPVAHLVNLGYENDVAYLFTVEVDPLDERQQSDSPDTAHIEIDLEWLVCEEECIPGFGVLTIERPIRGDNPRWNSEDAAIIERFSQRIPQPQSQSPWRVKSLNWHTNGDLHLRLEPADPRLAAADLAAPDLFPLDGNTVDPHAPAITPYDRGFDYRFRTNAGATPPAVTGMVLVSDGLAWEFPEIPVTRGALIESTAASFWVLLISAIIGGAILNLMPCVFPVLSIKLFSLIQAPGSGAQQTAHRLREGLMYSAGVLTTFFALGLLFLALRAGGAAVGWGFQLQSPSVVLFLIVLFWLIALSFLGSFEFGHRIMQWAGGGNSSSSFMTGVLAVFVAAPCTGPFMGAALGAAATLPSAYAMAIFLGLGVGLALPFLILTLSPALSSRLPKPGLWMERLRQFFAFPLFATVLWLVWVLAQLVGESAWLWSGTALLLIAFAIWLGQSASRFWKIAAWVVGVGALVLVSFLVMQAADLCG